MCYRCLTSVCDLLGLKIALSEIFVEAAVTLSLEAFEAGSIVVGELRVTEIGPPTLLCFKLFRRRGLVHVRSNSNTRKYLVTL